MYFIILSILFLSPHALNGQKKKKKSLQQPWEIEFKLGSAYQENLLNYSDKYLEKFENGDDSDRFHVTKMNDFRLETSAEVARSYRFSKQKEISISAEYSRSNYANTEIKNSGKYAFKLQYAHSKKAAIQLNFTFIPELYVRHYKRKSFHKNVFGELPPYLPFQFSIHQFGLSYDYKFTNRFKYTIYAGFSEFTFNRYFPHHNSNLISFGNALRYRLIKPLTVRGSYKFLQSRMTEDLESLYAKFETEFADHRFFEHQTHLSLQIKLPKISKRTTYLNMFGRLDYRVYQTMQEATIAKLYAGRIDQKYTFGASYSIGLTRAIRLRTVYKFQLRDSSTPFVNNLKHLQGEKNYASQFVGFQCMYKFKF